jgi:23S rRNA (uracil1939-C5)-methyltransferase
MNRKINRIYEKVEITDAGSEGKAVARIDDLVVFVPYAAPGDVADIRITKDKRSYLEGKAIHFHVLSDKRVEPVCEHFGICGGCSWQHMAYEHQLYYKQKQVVDNFTRIGKLDIPEISPILPSAETLHYRNKLEFTFSNRRWLTAQDMAAGLSRDMNAAGFHVPGIYDRVLDINRCYLQKDPSNAIRQAVKEYAGQNNLDFYDVRNWRGFLRNLIIRTTTGDDLMAILVFRQYEGKRIRKLLEYLSGTFPGITSLMFVINEKRNDIISDLEIRLFSGQPNIIETIPVPGGENRTIRFRIGPVSFFQTNPLQARRLYHIIHDFAGLSGKELVYDLYTGTGTIANMLSFNTVKVIGLEYVASAVTDARDNAIFNDIHNTQFFTGDIVKLLDEDFISANGKPDVIITDPPRAGMHEKVVRQILALLPEKVVYISCNPATQARDIALMKDLYRIEKLQPIDMFPQTHHVENVALLVRRT